tara:strand:- start:3873 stop:4946 length:1074 start_codon:yes stop_codon:yes gene_type:complete
MKISFEKKLDFDDVLIEPQINPNGSSRSSVSVEREFRFLNTETTWSGVPIVAANMDTTGTFEVAKAFYQHKMLVAIHKHYSLNDWEEFKNKNEKGILNHIMVSTGVSDKDFQKTKDIFKIVPEVKFLCIDIANGYSHILETFVKKARAEFPDKIIVAGNVVTKNITEVLIKAGADIVKVGIGPGSVCTTRVVTGVGMPQLSAVIDCADAAHGLKAQVMSDGGCKTPGDISKAFCGGADFVMIGGMFAGHDESGGETKTLPDGTKTKVFYGMSSSVAMEKHSGGVANYRASEGKVVTVPYKGKIDITIRQILGGVRSTCTYIGAEKIKDMPRRTTFNLVNRPVNTVFGNSDGVSSNNI